MKNRREYQAALSAEYALGTLRGSARLQFEKQMQQDPELAAEVARWQEAFAQLDNTLTPVPPPESVWKRIQLQLPPKPLPAASTDAASSPAVSGRYINKAMLGWAIAACLAVVLLIPKLWENTALKSPAMTPVAVLANNDAATNAGQWVVVADNRTQQLTVTPLHAAAVSADHSLQLWVIPAGGKPQSLGLLNNEASTQLAMSSTLSAGGAIMAISLEPKGGSPTGQPTGAVLYSGKIVI